MLHQVVDRMDSMLRLRTAHGSGPFEEFNSKIYPHRRNLVGSVFILTRCVEALPTKDSANTVSSVKQDLLICVG